jgi:sulfoxide reductase heme-binding subunit YedZ
MGSTPRFRAAWPLWLLLALPCAGLLVAAGRDDADLDALTALSGQMAAVLLVAAIGSTGLARLWAAAAGLVRHRRALGLAASGSSAVHLLLYFWTMGALEGDWRAVLAELDARGIWTGWLGLALLVPLALTSTDAAQRRMGRGWKRLQRLAWPAVVVALVHTYVVHDGQQLALGLAALLAGLQIYRFTPRPQHRAPLERTEL